MNPHQCPYYDLSETPLTKRTLFCQMTECADEETTGVKNSGILCETNCGQPQNCLGLQLPCLLPHKYRCVAPYPKARADEQIVTFVPSHANMFEAPWQDDMGNQKAYHVSSFENLLINLDASSDDDLHQCVWNAADIQDNYMNPGGISHSFFPPAQVYGFLTASGSKFCREWIERNKDVVYPLLPLQNSVCLEDSAFPRRVYVNTSARVMSYRYTGTGNPPNVDAIQKMDKPTLSIPNAGSDLDLFLNLDLINARNASLAMLVHRDRNIVNATWVQQWALGVYLRESSMLVQTKPFFQASLHIENISAESFRDSNFQRNLDYNMPRLFDFLSFLVVDAGIDDADGETKLLDVHNFEMLNFSHQWEFESTIPTPIAYVFEKRGLRFNDRFYHELPVMAVANNKTNVLETDIIVSYPVTASLNESLHDFVEIAAHHTHAQTANVLSQKTYCTNVSNNTKGKTLGFALSTHGIRRLTLTNSSQQDSFDSAMHWEIVGTQYYSLVGMSLAIKGFDVSTVGTR